MAANKKPAKPVKPSKAHQATAVLPPSVKAALEAAVARMGSQSKVAKDLGVSGAVVHNLLHDNYPGNVAGMAERIRGQYMAETVQCPVMGTLGKRSCLDNQARPFAATNPVRVQLHKACKTCPNRKESSS